MTRPAAENTADPPIADQDESIVAPPRRGHLLLAALLFTGIAIYGSFVRRDIPLEDIVRRLPTDFYDGIERFRQIRFYDLDIRQKADWVANILLFIPLGFFWLATARVDRKGGWAWLPAALVVAALTALSLLIEFTQQWYPPRTVSQNDIIAETLGGMVGVGLWFFIGQSVVNWLRSLVRDPQPASVLLKLLLLYVLGFLLVSVFPLDLTLTVGDFHEKVKAGRFVWIPFSQAYESIFDFLYQVGAEVVLWIPIGAWVVLTLVHRRQRMPTTGQAIVLGMLIVCGLEIAQIFVYSRYFETTDLLLGFVGVALGVSGTSRFLHRAKGASLPLESITTGAGLRRMGLWTVSVGVYATLLVLFFWYPLDFQWDSDLAVPRLESFFRPIGESLYRGSEANAVKQIVRKVTLFAPLGAGLLMLAASLPVPRNMRRVAVGVGLTLGVMLATGIELGQVVIPQHTPDFTDVLICSTGVALGMGIAAWLVRLKERQRAV